MNRSHDTDAIVLRTNRIGEIHRGLVMLTRDDGLVRAIAHGANSARGKLRGTTVPFCFGHAYLYTNPRTQSTKVTDMDATDFFSTIRGDLRKFYTASLWAEIVLKTYAAGDRASGLFVLLKDSLSELDRGEPALADLVSVQFLWRFLDHAGSQPDLRICACSGEFLDESKGAHYLRTEHGFCAEDHPDGGSSGDGEWHPDSGPIRWSSGALAYMRHAGSLPLPEALRVSPPAGAIVPIKQVLYDVVQDLVEAPLNTIRTGAGII